MDILSSFVKSLSMDNWNEKQLRLMALGGNKNLKEFNSNYDLADENVQLRYNTRAADFYRLKLRCISEMMSFDEEKPTYDAGREQISAEDMRSSDSAFREEQEINSSLPPQRETDLLS